MDRRSSVSSDVSPTRLYSLVLNTASAMLSRTFWNSSSNFLDASSELKPLKLTLMDLVNVANWSAPRPTEVASRPIWILA